MARLRWPVISLLPYVNKTPIYIVLSVQIRETNRIRSSAYNLLSEVPAEDSDCEPNVIWQVASVRKEFGTKPVIYQNSL